jgi:hypothetical protein
MLSLALPQKILSSLSKTYQRSWKPLACTLPVHCLVNAASAVVIATISRVLSSSRDQSLRAAAVPGDIYPEEASSTPFVHRSPGSSGGMASASRLYVTNLPASFTENELKQLFAQNNCQGATIASTGRHALSSLSFPPSSRQSLLSDLSSLSDFSSLVFL